MIRRPGSLQTDDYWVVLTKKPTGNVHVTFGTDGQIAVVGVTGDNNGTSGNTLLLHAW
jgi:hypothetical protein